MSIKHAPGKKTKSAPPAEAGYAATEGAPDLEAVDSDVDLPPLVHLRNWV